MPHIYNSKMTAVDWSQNTFIKKYQYKILHEFMKQNKIFILDDLNCFDIKKILIFCKQHFKHFISDRMITGVSWSCHVTTKNVLWFIVMKKKLRDCYRSQEVLIFLSELELTFDVNCGSVMYSLLKEKMPTKNKEIFQLKKNK